jgi:GntR family transcriptional regulator
MARPPARAEAVAAAIASDIDVGQLPPGAWLPPERELAEAHGVVRSTIRRAVDLLASRGIVERREGAGVRVRPERGRRNALDITRQDGTWRGFHVSMNRAGERPYTQTTITPDVPASPEVARWLGVPAGTRLLRRARIQGVHGEPPKQLSTTWVRPDIVTALPILLQTDTGPGGMHSRMEEQGLDLLFEESVDCRLVTADEASQLECPMGAPVNVFWRRCYDQDGRVVEVTHRIVPGGRMEQIYQYQSRIA